MCQENVFTKNKELLGDFVKEVCTLNALDDQFDVYKKYLQSFGFTASLHDFSSKTYQENNLLIFSAFKDLELFPDRNFNQHVNGKSNWLDFITKVLENSQLSIKVLDENKESNVLSENHKQFQLYTKIFYYLVVHQPSSSLINAFVIPLLFDLKPKEVFILRYLASGQHLKNIQDTGEISYSYANNLLKELRERLGGITSNQLMYILGRLDILDYL